MAEQGTEGTNPTVQGAENGTATGQQQSTGQANPAAQTTQAAQGGQQGQQVNNQDISGLVAKESRKAVEKLLQDAGIAAGDDPNAKLKDYKKWLDSQKTALEAAQGDVATLTANLGTEKAERIKLERKFLAMGKGIPAERVEAYTNLANGYLGEDGDFGKALDAALKDFPLAPGTPGQQERRGSVGAGANPPGSAGDKNEPLGAQLARTQLERMNKYKKKSKED